MLTDKNRESSCFASTFIVCRSYLTTLDNQKRILAKKKYQFGRRYFKKGKDFKKTEVKDTKKSEPICYECKKPGHIKAECPKLKKTEFRKKDSSKKFGRYKKKAMAATWSNDIDLDSESSSSEEEEEKANLAFMANIEEKILTV
ncbi:hypothetical protein Taro_030089 [Colocasia esculenta]|uniref:CCHC-type domain-containing protein n=1 Tax=Colocasia esculenta TaxID=4460 RepID=A0A843VWU6_COLES|nr:hypothetical protein [Colocasia esculenta]